MNTEFIATPAETSVETVDSEFDSEFDSINNSVSNAVDKSVDKSVKTTVKTTDNVQPVQAKPEVAKPVPQNTSTYDDTIALKMGGVKVEGENYKGRFKSAKVETSDNGGACNKHILAGPQMMTCEIACQYKEKSCQGPKGPFTSRSLMCFADNSVKQRELYRLLKSIETELIDSIFFPGDKLLSHEELKVAKATRDYRCAGITFTSAKGNDGVSFDLSEGKRMADGMPYHTRIVSKKACIGSDGKPMKGPDGKTIMEESVLPNNVPLSSMFNHPKFGSTWNCVVTFKIASIKLPEGFGKDGRPKPYKVAVKVDRVFLVKRASEVDFAQYDDVVEEDEIEGVSFEDLSIGGQPQQPQRPPQGRPQQFNQNAQPPRNGQQYGGYPNNPQGNGYPPQNNTYQPPQPQSRVANNYGGFDDFSQQYDGFDVTDSGRPTF